MKNLDRFAFRIRFHLSDGDAVNIETEKFEIHPSGSAPHLILHSLDSEKISTARRFSISCSGLDSQETASDIGMRVKHALLIAGAQLKMGVDVGKDIATSGVGKFLRDQAMEHGVQSLNDIHGLLVFPDDMPVNFIRVFSVKVIVGRPPEKFTEALIHGYELAPSLDQKIILALEMYSASHFESSLRARFLTLVTAVEVLADQEELDEEVRLHIENLIEETKRSNIPFGRKELLSSRLGQLKKESINSACKGLVTKYLDDESASQFTNYYSIRGKILHNGVVPKGVNLGSEVPKLDKMISQLLLAIIGTAT